MTDASELQRAIDRLTTTVEQLRTELVRNDVYQAEKSAAGARVSEVEKDVLTLEAKVDKAEERRRSDRQLWLASLVLPIVVGLVLLYVTTQIGSR